MDDLEEDNTENKVLNKKELTNKIKAFKVQVSKIDNCLILLNQFLENVNLHNKSNLEKKEINKYNQQCRVIKSSYVNNSFQVDDIAIACINVLRDTIDTKSKETKQEHDDNIEKAVSNEEQASDTKCIDNKLKNNNTLLISEKQGKVVLPYTAKEVTDILNSKDNTYKTTEEVIEEEFTRDFSRYKSQFFSRYNETMKLAREREKYSLLESITLATEMMGKKLLHPAIISACRTLNELDVYLDCLDKNELEDFKIFKVKYELYPMVVKKGKI